VGALALPADPGGQRKFTKSSLTERRCGACWTSRPSVSAGSPKCGVVVGGIREHAYL
jgi:hypothetical protein